MRLHASLCICLLLIACDGADDEAPTMTVDPAMDAAHAREQLEWLTGLLNGPADAITEEEVTPHFDASFLGQVPAPVVVSTLRTLARQLAPVNVMSTEDLADGSVQQVVEGAAQMLFRLQLLAPDPSGSITGLLFLAAPELDPALRDFAVIDERLQATAARSSLLIATVDGERCSPLQAARADAQLPLAGVSKLFVLGALVARVEAGESNWTDEVAIRDDWRSPPTGELNSLLAGTPVQLGSLADAMIAINDNSATDHLLQLTGRPQVEAALTTLGHSEPAANTPFLTSRDALLLKLAASDEEQQQYVDASADERRRLVDEVYPGLTVPDDMDQRVLDWTTPRLLDSVGWFGSATDVCNAMAWLRSASERGPGTRALRSLSINPGLTIDREPFSYIGFKGGAEPGALAVSWLLRRRDDSSFRVVTALAADAEQAIPDMRAFYFALAAVHVAAR